MATLLPCPFCGSGESRIDGCPCLKEVCRRDRMMVNKVGKRSVKWRDYLEGYAMAFDMHPDEPGRRPRPPVGRR